MHKEEYDYSALHLYCRLLVKRVLWFALDDLYSRYYVAARGGVGCGRLDANVDADAEAYVDE